MKTLLSCLFLVAAGQACIAQGKCQGVYLTYNQFDNNKPAYTQDANTRIRLHSLLGRHYITIKEQGKKTVLYKDDIYAYRTVKGKIIRFWKNNEYQLLEKGDVWIYYRDITTPLGKGVKRERKYYFSLSGKDEVLALTISNLKHSFPKKDLFKNFLDAHFRRDAELSLYNNHSGEFHVNYLLKSS